MAYVFLDERVDPPIWRFQFTEWLGPANLGFKGRRRTGTGQPITIEGGKAEAKRQTVAMAEIVQAKQNRVRLGWDAPPKSTDLGQQRPYTELRDEYLAWGESQGGHHGFAWGEKHASNRKFHLEFWGEELGIVKLGDLTGCLPRVEKILRRLQRAEASGKTLNNYSEALRAFCAWCVQRGLMDKNPLDGLAAFDEKPKTVRRALTVAEIKMFLEGCEGENSTKHSRRRRLGYELALASGFRAGELRSLKVKHLDTKRGGVHLDAAAAKNRRETFQPLPSVLVSRLAESVKGKGQEEPLVFVSREASEALKTDLERVGLSRWSTGLLENGKIGLGKVDFHAMRTAYVTMLLESGADVKTAQTLARHSDPRLTLHTYGKARAERVNAVAEAIGKAILPVASSIQNAHKQAVGAEGVVVTTANEMAYAGENECPGRGSNPHGL